VTTEGSAASNGTDQPDRVGVVGLGAMGRPIAECLARGGFDVVGYDRAETKHGAGVRLAAGLAEVGATDVVLVIVPTDDDVTSVVSDLVGHGHPGLVIVICSSVHPATCRRMADLAASADMYVVDAALTGGIRGAERGTLNLLVGGDAEVVARVSPVLLAFAKDYHVLGGPGAGQVAKTANNLIHWAEIVAIDEAFRLAAALGVDPAALRVALQQGSTDSRTMRELELMRFTWYAKDLATARAMADEVGIALPVADLSRRLMDGVTVDSVRALLTPGHPS
jgi:3-hydroxyisobutyrate dehydrogenase-like beta-hydroxyacid dehydrogenase